MKAARRSVHRRRALPAWLAAGLALIAAPALAERSLYDWVAVAPVVAAVDSIGDNGKYTELLVRRTLRGDLAEGQRIRVDLRHANAERDRETHRRSLRLDEGSEYLVLLRPAPARSKRRKTLPTFDLVRGVLGARELPAEGAAPILDGLATLIEVLELDHESARWQRLASLLEDTNPIVIENALEQFVKFQRGSGRDLPAVRPLLDHPDPAIRGKAIELVGEVIGRRRSLGEVELPAIQSELVALARRDPEVDVRVRATRALDALDDPSVDRILGEIAETDPDQDVRYAAERLLYERSLRPSSASGANAGRPD